MSKLKGMKKIVPIFLILEMDCFCFNNNGSMDILYVQPGTDRWTDRYPCFVLSLQTHWSVVCVSTCVSLYQIRMIVSTLARSDVPVLTRSCTLSRMPGPSTGACCSHASAVGDWHWLICMVCTLLRIFFWWPARVTPILSKSLSEREEIQQEYWNLYQLQSV